MDYDLPGIDEATAEQLIRSATDVVAFQNSVGGKKGKQTISPAKEFLALVNAAAPTKEDVDGASGPQAVSTRAAA